MSTLNSNNPIFLALALLLINLSGVWLACGDNTGQQTITASQTVPVPESKVTFDRQFLWHLFGETGINIEPAWALTKNSPKATVAVIDHGFLPLSPAFAGCNTEYKLIDVVHGDRDVGEHGTIVTSLISTCPKNALGLVGVNDRAKVLWVEAGKKMMSKQPNLMLWAVGLYDCTNKTLLNCTNALDPPADVVNMSSSWSASAQSNEHVAFLRLSKWVRDRSTIWVAGSGNNGSNADLIFPHSLPGVVSAGATDKLGNAASFSNWGETVDIMAPGVDLPVAGKQGLEYANGTSLSSPLVAGVVSLMKEVYRDLNWKTAIYFMQSTAHPMGCDAYCINNANCLKDCCVNGVQVCTPGRLNAGEAVAMAQEAFVSGLPKASLVDSDVYFVELRSLGSGPMGEFTLRNVGGLKGRYTISSDNALLSINPSVIELEAKGQPGDSKTITISATSPHPGWTNIKIRSPNAGKVAGYTDELVVSAQ